MHAYRFILPALCGVWLCGCARVVVRHVPEGDTSEGVHFYEPRPYLVISDVAKTDDQGNVVGHSYTSTITYLPDKTRYYVVTVKQGLGTVNGSVKLVDGWRLDTLGAQTDSKIPETIGAVTGLIKEVGGLAVKSMKPEEAVGLYRIDIAADGTVTLVKQTHWTTDSND